MLETQEFKELDIILTKLNEIDNIECNPILIGSHALKHYYPTYKIDKNYTEYDIICNRDFVINLLNNDIFEKLQLKINTKEDFLEYKIYLITKNNIHYDIDIVYNKNMSNYLISDYSGNKNITVIQPMIDIYVAPLDVLEGITYSHIYHNINFFKHIKKLHILRKLIGVKKDFLNNYELINFLENDESVVYIKEKDRKPEVNNIIKTRRNECNIKFGVPASHINLNMLNDEFLEKEGNLTVKKYIKHDLIHDMVKINDKAMYLYLKHEDKLDKAFCDKKLWNKLPLKKKLDCVKEEAMVLAIERKLLHDSSLNYKTEFIEALTKICTFITKGWFREFAIDNFNLLTTCPHDLTQFVNKIKNDYYNNLASNITNELKSNNNIKDISNLIYLKQFNIDLELDLSNNIYSFNDYKNIVFKNIMEKYNNNLITGAIKDRLLEFTENNTNRLFYIKKNILNNTKDIYVCVNITNTLGHFFLRKQTYYLTKKILSGCYHKTIFDFDYYNDNHSYDKDIINLNNNFIDFDYYNYNNNVNYFFDESDENFEKYIKIDDEYSRCLNYNNGYSNFTDDMINELFKYNFSIYETDKNFEDIDFSYNNKYLLSKQMTKVMSFSIIKSVFSYDINDYNSDYSSDNNTTSKLHILRLILNYPTLKNTNIELNKKIYNNTIHINDNDYIFEFFYI